MAMSWASKRKLIFASITTGVVFFLILIPSFLIFYKAPTCFDKIMNGSEMGIDCGGKCTRLCQSAFLPARIEWGDAKLEKVANGLYNASSYLVNTNLSGAAVDVPYKISLYDSSGVFITDHTGLVTLYPHRNSLAFSTGIRTDQRIPSKASFEFTEAPVWFKSDDLLGNISILDKQYREDENGSSLLVTLQNNSLTPYKNVTISIVLYDASGNVIGFSQTNVDSIDPKKQVTAPFTWPTNRKGSVTSIEVIPIIRPLPSN